YAVVLFDEIEKAHPEVFNVLLQLLDDGRLTDGQGRTVDFRNTVVIMTSNLLAGEDLERLNRDEIVRRLQRFFRPEFLNRIDEIVVFHPLDERHIEQIVDIQLNRLRRLLAERKLALELTPAAKRHLAQVGYDPAFGARPLKRAIQHELQDPLSMAILEGRYREGDTVRVDARDGTLVLE
ncbi:MAG: AAA family ATPase, partial [Thermoflexus sp.]